MPDRKLQFSSNNLSYEDAVAIARREIEENSPFNVEEILKDSTNRSAFTSSNNSVSVAKIDGTVTIDLNGSQEVMDAIEEALKSQAGGGSPARSGTGPTNPELGGTGPDDMEFDEANPPSMSQPGEDMEESKNYYVTVDEGLFTKVVAVEQGQEPMVSRGVATKGPYQTQRAAEKEYERINNARAEGEAKEIQDVLEQRFQLYGTDNTVLVEVMKNDGERGKAEMPRVLADEAEDFGWATIVQDTVPDEMSLPPGRQPNYISPRHLEEWSEIFQYLQEYTADEPEVPSMMDDERVPQSEADKEARMSVARREDPQAVAQIYENGVVSLNRDGSVDTLDTSVGIFIDRQDYSVSMGYMAERLNLSTAEIDEVVANVREFLENNNG